MNQQAVLFKLSQFHKTAILIGQRALIAIIIILVFWLIAILIKRLIMRVPKNHPTKKHIFKVLADTSKIVILLIGIITALGSIGVNVSAIVASLGLSGFAIGFALKDSISNILAGTIILIYQPYKVGNTIAVSSSQGKVIEINLRYTILEAENKQILIPNATMLNSTVNIISG